MLPRLAGIYRHPATAIVVLAVGVTLSGAAAYLVAGQVEREARLRFEAEISDARIAIESRVRAYADVLLGIRGLFIASDAVSRETFRRYVGSLDLNRRYPGIQVIHYSRRITALQRADFEATVRGDTSVDPRGYPDFAIRPPGNRPEHVVAQYVEPMAGNERALGLDLGGDPVRLAALERTRDSGELTASGTIALALDPSRHPGFAMRLPIYRKDAPLATVAQRREAFSGVVSTSFIVIDLMRGVLSESFLRNMHVHIHDAGFLDDPQGPRPPDAENLMFDSHRLQNAAPPPHPAFNEHDTAALRSVTNLDIGGRRWNLYFSARQQRGAAFESWLPLIVLAGGTTISLLLGGLIRSLATSGSRAVELANRITDNLRRSEARLSEAQRMTQQLIEALPNPIFFKGTDGRYLGVNKAWEAYFATPRGAFIGKTVHDLYPGNPEVADRLHAMDQELWQRPGTQVYETSITTPDGQPHEAIYYKATFSRADGSIAGLIGTIIDITERKSAEQALRTLNAELERRVAERTAKLETALRELESFSYSVSHDLRAPARAMTGFARIVLEDHGSQVPEEGRRLLARIAKAGESMGAMVDGLLELTRISRGEIKRQSVDLAALAAEVWRDLMAAEGERQVALHLECEASVQGDPVLLRILLANLLGNARKYTRNRPDAAAWFGRNPRREFFVRDNGVGFDMAHTAKLFGAFQRLHTEREFEGHGIGLALARLIVERHGGHIRPESEPGRGATFYFTLGEAP